MSLFLLKCDKADGTTIRRMYTQGFIAGAAAVKLWREVNGAESDEEPKRIDGSNVWVYTDGGTADVCVTVRVYDAGTDIE